MQTAVIPRAKMTTTATATSTMAAIRDERVGKMFNFLDVGRGQNAIRIRSSDRQIANNILYRRAENLRVSFVTVKKTPCARYYSHERKE